MKPGAPDRLGGGNSAVLASCPRAARAGAYSVAFKFEVAVHTVPGPCAAAAECPHHDAHGARASPGRKLKLKLKFKVNDSDHMCM